MGTKTAGASLTKKEHQVVRRICNQRRHVRGIVALFSTFAVLGAGFCAAAVLGGSADLALSLVMFVVWSLTVVVAVLHNGACADIIQKLLSSQQAVGDGARAADEMAGNKTTSKASNERSGDADDVRSSDPSNSRPDPDSA